MLELYYPPFGRSQTVDTLFLSPSPRLSWLTEGNRVGARGINFLTSCFILKHFTKALKICPNIDISPNSFDFGCQMFTHLGECLLPCPVFSVSEPRGRTLSWSDIRLKPFKLMSGAVRKKNPLMFPPS